MSTVESSPVVSLSDKRGTLWVLGILLAVVLYGFGNVFAALWADHWNDPQYSHGYLVPLLAIFLLWMRWDASVLPRFQDVATAHRWWGLGLLTLGLSFRLLATHFGMEVPDMVALIPCLAGVLLLAGGWRLFVWAGPVVAFLVFMFPLPWRVAQLLLNPLQKLATACSAYLLQALGYGAIREGNVIHIAGVPMEVIDACSGLRMLTVFLALCGAVALMIDRPLWERLLIFCSAVPIALAVNVARITATGMAHYHIGGPWIKHVFHDQAGLFMMPVAIVLLFLELAVLNKLFVEEELPVVHAVRKNRQSQRLRARQENVGYRVG